MISQIKNPYDVEAFVVQLVSEGLNYHPDDDFENYINLKTDEPSYTPEEAQKRNELNQQCFEVCEKFNIDLYDLSQEVFLKETGLDKYIPLPSQAHLQ